MSAPEVLSGHRDLGRHPVLPGEPVNAAGQPLDGEPETKEASPIAELSAPRYHVKDKKTGKLSYPKDAPRVRRFQSTIEKLRIQLSGRAGWTDPGGNWNPAVSEAIEFVDYYYTTEDPERIIKIETSRKYGVDIWDVDAKEIAVKELTDNAVMERVMSDPELVKTLKAKFGKTDFVDKKQSGKKS
jgi:hypothetical protein